MSEPLRAFMAHLIDYAGLFPPARLPLDEAIRNYARFRREGDAWMLDRFICPARRLRELQPQKAVLFAEGEPFRFSVLGSAGRSPEEFLSHLKKDLALIGEFLDFHEGRVQADLYETRLPDSFAEAVDPAALEAFLSAVAETVDGTTLPAIRVFYEAGFGGEWRSRLETVMTGLARHGEARTGGVYGQPGLKVRCGGEDPALVPAPEQVAAVLAESRRCRIPVKATAGLHHPVRHHNADAGMVMHGFLNVFGAGILAAAHDLEEAQVLEIVADSDPGNFLFTRRAFAWRNLRVSADDIRTARRDRVLSFGSCSFDEPREDLRRMNLL